MTLLPRPSAPRTLDEAIGQIDALWELVGVLTTKLEEQQARNDELSAQLEELLAKKAGKSSRNSSMPPSSDTAAQRSGRSKKPRSDRRRGAQPGHEKHERALLEPDEAQGDTIERYFPAAIVKIVGR